MFIMVGVRKPHTPAVARRHRALARFDPLRRVAQVGGLIWNKFDKEEERLEHGYIQPLEGQSGIDYVAFSVRYVY